MTKKNVVTKKLVMKNNFVKKRRIKWVIFVTTVTTITPVTSITTVNTVTTVSTLTKTCLRKNCEREQKWITKIKWMKEIVLEKILDTVNVTFSQTHRTDRPTDQPTDGQLNL